MTAGMHSAPLDIARATLRGWVSEDAEGRVMTVVEGASIVDYITTVLDELEDLEAALASIAEPYPVEVFPDLQKRDEVFAAMRAVNRYATEQFWAECARQRAEVAQRTLERRRADRE